LAPLEKIHQEYQSQGLTVVGLENWSRFSRNRLLLWQQQYGLSFPLLGEGPPTGYYSSRSPAVYVIDKQGKVVAFRHGGSCDWESPQFKALLITLLAE